MTTGHLDHLLGLRVEIYDGAAGESLMSLGEVVAICYAPSLGLRQADGSIAWHSSELPRIEYRPHAVGALCEPALLKVERGLGGRS